MWRYIVLFIFLITQSTKTYGQTGWVPGYIKLANKDSLQGELFNREWDSSPTYVTFRYPSGQKIRINVKEIKAVYFAPTQEIYEQHTPLVETSSHEINSLSNDATLHFERDTLLAQRLVSGAINLYRYKSSTGRVHLLIQNQADTLQDLVYRRYLDNGTNQIKEIPLFRYQLNRVLADNPSLVQKIPRLEFEEIAIAKVIVAYNQSKNTFSKTLESIKKPLPIETGMVLGLSVTKMQYRYLDLTVNFPIGVNPYLGLFANIPMSRHRQQWSFYNELAGKFYHGSTTSPFYNSNTSSIVYNPIHIAVSYVKIISVVRWQIPQQNLVRPFLMAGFTNGFGVRLQGDFSLAGDRHYELGFIASAGLRWKKWSVEGRYERSNGTANALYVSSPTNSTYAVIAHGF